jgi:hypothetical protein
MVFMLAPRPDKRLRSGTRRQTTRDRIQAPPR